MSSCHSVNPHRGKWVAIAPNNVHRMHTALIYAHIQKYASADTARMKADGQQQPTFPLTSTPPVGSNVWDAHSSSCVVSLTYGSATQGSRAGKGGAALIQSMIRSCMPERAEQSSGAYKHAWHTLFFAIGRFVGISAGRRSSGCQS